MQPHPTPYEDVNEVLALLLARQRAILGEGLVGLYLYGSLATGDFDRESSDIDFVAATAGELARRVSEARGVPTRWGGWGGCTRS